MAKTKSVGYTDTPIEGVTALTYPRSVLNFNTDFRVKKNLAGSEVVLTNLTSPTDRPERIRIAYSEIPNIYNGTGVEASVSAPTKKGVSILVQVTEVISVTDSTDADFRVDLPVSYHLVVKVPVSEYITASDIHTGIGRLVSSLFDSGVTTDARLEALLRGSLVPSGL